MSREAALDKIDANDHRRLARAISLMEDDIGASLSLLSSLISSEKRAFHVGVTGPPGAGKSTLIDSLVTEIRKQGLTVGVIAVDPSSVRTGGALLGDRIRMQSHATDPGVFIRSMGTRGETQGLSFAARLAVRLFDAAGFDLVFIETVGIGQVGTDIESASDKVLLLFVPESGDVIQAMKAGIIEIADMVVINKADRDGAEALAGAIDAELNSRDRTRVPVTLTCASTGRGVAEAAAWILDRRAEFESAGGADLSAEFEALTREMVQVIAYKTIDEFLSDDNKARKVLDRVRSGGLDIYAAALELLRTLSAGERFE